MPLIPGLAMVIIIAPVFKAIGFIVHGVIIVIVIIVVWLVVSTIQKKKKVIISRIFIAVYVVLFKILGLTIFLPKRLVTINRRWWPGSSLVGGLERSRG